ncbi:carboxypeptidase-like regulatory domain-containing protein [Larkinella rosea]|uniref:Carboxypeptidase-like regulatory domain-containing protein n=1 Tax=Larkinella rosea TaxID=2025312 RepID=A0A3P1BT81_9BACT|nr:carboxypeptidase-like regulatory domain-containing protein [Larkinella rosea]RRB04119.1 carboxypeptidase-like regulatory domain-containing protein [Larkinella rosea]
MYTNARCRFLFLIVFLFTSFYVFAQTTLKGQVLIETDGQPVAYALITEPQHRFGTYADAQGRFTATIPAGIDTLLISCVGFETLLLPLAGLSESTAYRLRAKPNVLTEIVVRGRKPRLATVGATRKRAPIVWGNCSGRNIEFALHVRNTNGIQGYLHRVSYLIARGGMPTAPFRVRVYAITDGEPGADLLPQSVVTSARRGNTWCEVDLSRYQIAFPKEGLFIAMEWLPTDEARYKFATSFKMPDGQKNARECFGQYLAFNRELRTATYWERINGGTWRRNAPLSRVGLGEHPVIQAKIALE